jgi:hypothetical protein
MADGNMKNSNNDDDEEDKSTIPVDEAGATQPGAAMAVNVAGTGANMVTNSVASLNNNNLTTNMAGRPRSKGKRGRKDDGTNATTAVAPTFLMENSKRRKRGNGNS